jgi:hypothetical protein
MSDRRFAKTLSGFCRTGMHNWCANRNYEETHCGCPCHAKAQERRERAELARLKAKYEVDTDPARTP